MAVTEPEKEFHKAALDACRSTIVQQEADLKRLNESLDIRNKTIMQLESQVGVAKSYLASRDPSPPGNIPTAITDQLTSLCTSLNLLLTKMISTSEHLSPKTQAVNVYNTTCHQQREPVMTDKASQTSEPIPTPPANVLNGNEPREDSSIIISDTLAEVDASADSETILTCTLCHRSLESSSLLDDHLESIHDCKPSSSEKEKTEKKHDKICLYCNNVFESNELLAEHVSQNHSAASISLGQPTPTASPASSSIQSVPTKENL